MSSIRNKVQLIGNVGQTPELTNLDNGKKVCRFSLATNEVFKAKNGEKTQKTDWHNLVVWGRNAEIIQRYAAKGQQIAIEGKLTSRSYEDKQGVQRYITEVNVSELVLLGNHKESNKS